MCYPLFFSAFEVIKVPPLHPSNGLHFIDKQRDSHFVFINWLDFLRLQMPHFFKQQEVNALYYVMCRASI